MKQHEVNFSATVQCEETPNKKAVYMHILIHRNVYIRKQPKIPYILEATTNKDFMCFRMR
jgi:hypothetical protein